MCYHLSVVWQTTWQGVWAIDEQREPEQVYAPGRTWREYLDEQLNDPEFRAEYEALEAEFALIRQLIDLRIRRGLSQRQLAERAGTAARHRQAGERTSRQFEDAAARSRRTGC